MDMDPPVYSFLRQLPEGVVLELPLPTLTRVFQQDLDPDYVYWSTRHWRKLLNGYSGYYPATYPGMISQLKSLPDSTSLQLVKERQVRYVLVHETYFAPGEASRLLSGLLANIEFTPLGRYRDWIGQTYVFEVAGPWKGTWRNDDRDVQLH
jgi:hypothetical protein